MILICGKIRIQSGVSRDLPGQTGSVLRQLRLQDAGNADKGTRMDCPYCSADHDLDTNSAINIQHKGMTELMAACYVVKAHQGLCNSGSMLLAVQKAGTLTDCVGEQSHSE